MKKQKIQLSAPNICSYKQTTRETSIVSWSRAQTIVVFRWCRCATKPRSLFKQPCDLLSQSIMIFVRTAFRRMVTNFQSKGYVKPMVAISPSYRRSCTVTERARARNSFVATVRAMSHSIYSQPRPATKDAKFASTTVERDATKRLC